MKKLCFITLSLFCCSCTVRYDCIAPEYVRPSCYTPKETVCIDNGIKEELARLRHDMDFNYQIQNERSIQKEICKFKMAMEERFNAQNEKMYEFERKRCCDFPIERSFEYRNESKQIAPPEIKVIVVPVCQTASRDLTEIRETVAKTFKECL